MDVKLVLQADNSQYIQKVKQAQDATQKLHDTSVAGGKREKGILQEIDDTLVRLTKARQKAFTIEEIEKYNKKIQETKQYLEEYEQAGVQANTKIEKSGNTLLKSIGSWAAGLVVFSSAMRVLKETVISTEVGFQALNKVGAVWKQLLAEIVSGNKLTFKSVAADIRMAINAMKEIDKERVIQRTQLLEIAKAQTTYNQLYFAASDQTKTDAARLQVINQAMLEHEIIIEKKINNTKKELANVRLLLAIPTKNPNRAWLDEEAALLVKLENLEGDRFQETKRLESLRTGIIQSEIDKQKIANDKARQAEGDANEKYYIQSRDDFFNYIDDLNKKKEDAWDFETKQSKIAFNAQSKTAKAAWDLMIENEKKLKDAEDKVVKAKQDNLASAGQAVLDYIDIVDQLAQREVDEAERKRELLDTSIDEKQSELEVEAELAEAGVANNLDLKRKELEALKKQRAKALKDEEEALKKAHTLKVAAIVADKALAIAKVITASEIAKAEARILIANPITAIPGAVLLATIRVSEAISLAAIVAAAIAASLSKFAKGGWTGDGSQRDSTGERMAGIVHEKEFVVRKGQAHKFRDVLEAINRDDKKMIFNSFNKLNPELYGGTTVNNVVVQNEGPNKRLDKVNAQLERLNRKQVKEEVSEWSNMTIIRKGNTVRTIKR